jgi:ankyrin repeat protein
MDKPEYVTPTTGEKEMTALMSHCFYCYPGGVKRELREGADPNAQDNCGYTALMWLCRMYDKKHFRERKRMFRALIKNGASLTVTDAAGESILFHARTGPAKRFRNFVKFEVFRLTHPSSGTR